jgi:hypothetical protein
MARKQSGPRRACFYGQFIDASTFPDGTWLEAEEFCYPHGGMGRRARVNFADGSQRVVRCGLADTWFSIPASAHVRSKYVRGFITADSERGVVFHEYNQQGDD